MKHRDLLSISASVLVLALGLLPSLGRAATPCPPAQIGVEGGNSATTPCATVGAGTYSTNFGATENPISESGKWINGLSVGGQWNNVQTTPGKAFAATFVGLGSNAYDDPISILSTSFMTFAANQYAEATTFRASGYAPTNNHEVELLLRFQITANNAHGYEVLYSHDGWLIIVRWNGPPGDYTELASTNAPYQGRAAADGDVIRAEVSGSTIRVFKNGSPVISANDSTWSAGQPGMGFFPRTPGASLSSYGWRNFTAGGL